MRDNSGKLWHAVPSSALKFQKGSGRVSVGDITCFCCLVAWHGGKLCAAGCSKRGARIPTVQLSATVGGTMNGLKIGNPPSTMIKD